MQKKLTPIGQELGPMHNIASDLCSEIGYTMSALSNLTLLNRNNEKLGQINIVEPHEMRIELRVGQGYLHDPS